MRGKPSPSGRGKMSSSSTLPKHAPRADIKRYKKTRLAHRDKLMNFFADWAEWEKK
jgi:hypothetical protein